MISKGKREPFNTDETVTMSGVVHIETFKDANDRPEGASILYLDNPIDVKEDDYGGPANNISKIQLIYHSDSKFVKGFNYDGKHVKVIGTLMFGITAHHHTQVLMEIKSIEVAK